MKRTCSKCKEPIKKHHHWRTVQHHFLWFWWTTTDHYDCDKPETIHENVIRLEGEVPLAFEDVDV
jgi:hypothetical protein